MSDKPAKGKLHTFACGACRAKVKVPSSKLGATGKCPTCDAPMTFGERPKKAAPVKVKVKCEHCGAGLTVPKKALGKSTSCPKCKETTRVGQGAVKALKPKPDKDDPLAVTDLDEPDVVIEPVERKAENKWDEMIKARADSYWVAQWRALYYPFQAIGALLVFVAGVPLVLAILEILAKYALLRIGALRLSSTATGLAAAGVVAFAILLFLAMTAYFASFLYALIRVSAEGRTASPVIEGMVHRANLAALLLWVVVYFGPGVAAWVYLADPEGFGGGHLLAILLWGIGGVLAPMGLLCSATQGAMQGINPGRVVPAIVALAKEYFYMILVVAVGTGLFLAAGVYCAGLATDYLALDPPQYGPGFGLRIASGLLLCFPLVIATRCVGMVLKYHHDKLPFEVDIYSEHKGNLLPLALAGVAVLLVFLPMQRQAEDYATTRGVAEVAGQRLKQAYQGLRDRSRDTVRTLHSYEDVEKWGQRVNLVNPVEPDRYPYWKFFTIDTLRLRRPLGGGDTTRRQILLYSPDPVDKKENLYFLLLTTGDVLKLEKEEYDQALAAQEALLAEPDRDKWIPLYNKLQEFISPYRKK